MFRHLLLKPEKLNRLAIVGMLPLMVVAIMVTSQTTTSAKREPPEPPREGTLVVANLRAGSLTIHSLGGDGQSRTLALESAPHELLAIGGRIYATLPHDGTVTEIDPRAPGVLRTLAAGEDAHGLSADGDTLFVTLDGANQVIVIDHTTMRATATYPTGDTPHSVAFASGALYITDARDGLLRRIDLATGASTTAKAGRLPESVAVTGSRVAVADAVTGTITWYTLSLQPLGTLILEGEPVRVLALDDNRVAISLNDSAKVAIVNLAAGKLEHTLTVAGHPDGLCLSPSGRFLAVVNNEHDSINIFRTTDWRVMVTLGTGDGPGACTWF